MQTVVFLDTNIFIQCRDLRELPWSELFGGESQVLLVIARPIQDEIDRLKQDGRSRRAKRAKNTARLLRELLNLKGASKIILEGPPRVDIQLNPRTAPRADRSGLDYTRVDDRLVAAALDYRDQHPDVRVVLLTNDTGPAVTAQHAGLEWQLTPDAWLLEPEPDERDKIIAEHEQRIARLEKATPLINVVSALGDVPITITACEFSPLGPDVVEELIQSVTTAHPPTSDFSAPHMDSPPGVLGVRAYYPPNKEAIENYLKVEYPGWIAQVRLFLEHLHHHLEEQGRSSRYAISVSNEGSTSAARLLVELRVTQGLALLPPDDPRTNRRPETNVGLGISRPPEPPQGEWRHGLTSLERAMASLTLGRSGDSHAERLSRLSVSGFHPFASVRDTDRYKFYWRHKRPIEPCEAHELECEEFRHKTEPEEFGREISILHGARPSSGCVTCRVSATNLPEPVAHSTPVVVTYVRGDTKTEALRMIADISRAGG